LATLLGFAGGRHIWLSWVEFSFVWVARDRQLVPAAWGTKETLPEHCVSLLAVSVMFAIPLLLFLNRKTWCSAFMSLHRWLGLRVCERSWAQA